MPSRATMAWNASERCRCHQSEPVASAATRSEVRRRQRFEARAVADHRHRGEKFDRQRLAGRFERLSQVVDAESTAASGERHVDRRACAHPFAPLLSFGRRLPLTNGLDQSMQRGQAQRVTADRYVTAHGFRLVRQRRRLGMLEPVSRFAVSETLRAPRHRDRPRRESAGAGRSRARPARVGGWRAPVRAAPAER